MFLNQSHVLEFMHLNVFLIELLNVLTAWSSNLI